MLQLEFFGAAGEVTGSCHVLTVGDRRVLLDCGMIQGGRRSEERNAEAFPFDAASIDAVVLSHAHLDHSGRLPLLVKRGFRGPIYTHNASRDLVDILLQDSAHLQRSIVRRVNRRRERRGETLLTELYDAGDAERTLSQVKGQPYNRWIDVVPGVRVQLHDAGHIMGSAIVEVAITDAGVDRTLVFSGDLGQFDTPILRDPTLMARADIVLMESTYGGRKHRSRESTLIEMGELLAETARIGGNILIPAFAVGRSQELLYHLGNHYDDWEVGRWQIFLDSPMAISTTKVYWDYPHLYDEEATRLSRRLSPMPSLPNLRMSRTAEQSKAIKEINGGAIVIAGSGMCNGGRILHHFRNNIGNPSTRVLFTGYQAPGSLGRRIIEGEDEVRIHGREYEVRAGVATVGGLSAHGDVEDLGRWYGAFANSPPLYLVHGDPRAGEDLRAVLQKAGAGQVELTQPGLRVDLASL
ncbi:MAG: MBL fold metallo-hydrolase [Pseudomonadota bacterium]